MATQYRVYQNDGAGGPVNYSSVVTTTSSLTWTSGALSANSQWKFAVRPYDTVTTKEDQNVDAMVTVLIGASQTDVTNLPDAPTSLTLTAEAGGNIRVSWFAKVLPRTSNPPTSFKVYSGTPSISYASVTATVTATSYLHQYSTVLTGLSGGSSYEIGVRAANATGTETNTTTQTLVADSTAPGNVANFSGTPST